MVRAARPLTVPGQREEAALSAGLAQSLSCGLVATVSTLSVGTMAGSIHLLGWAAQLAAVMRCDGR